MNSNKKLIDWDTFKDYFQTQCEDPQDLQVVENILRDFEPYVVWQEFDIEKGIEYLGFEIQKNNKNLCKVSVDKKIKFHKNKDAAIIQAIGSKEKTREFIGRIRLIKKVKDDGNFIGKKYFEIKVSQLKDKNDYKIFKDVTEWLLNEIE